MPSSERQTSALQSLIGSGAPAHSIPSGVTGAGASPGANAPSPANEQANSGCGVDSGSATLLVALLAPAALLASAARDWGVAITHANAATSGANMSAVYGWAPAATITKTQRRQKWTFLKWDSQLTGSQPYTPFLKYQVAATG